VTLHDLIPEPILTGLTLMGLLSFVKWVLIETGEFIRFLKQWWTAL